MIAPCDVDSTRALLAKAFEAVQWEIVTAYVIYDDEGEGGMGCDIEESVYCERREAGCTSVEHEGACSDHPWDAQRPAQPGRCWVEVGISGCLGPYEAVMEFSADHPCEWAYPAPGSARGTVERIAADTRRWLAKDRGLMIQVIEMRADGVAEAVTYDAGVRMDGYTIEIEPDADGLCWFGDADWQWDQYRFLGMVE